MTHNTFNHCDNAVTDRYFQNYIDPNPCSKTQMVFCASVTYSINKRREWLYKKKDIPLPVSAVSKIEIGQFIFKVALCSDTTTNQMVAAYHEKCHMPAPMTMSMDRSLPVGFYRDLLNPNVLQTMLQRGGTRL